MTQMTVADLGRDIQGKRVSPVEVTRAFLERTESLEPKLNAFITCMPELALAAAKKAEAEIQRGVYRGPLHGIPFAVKDLFWTKGVRTTSGSPIHRDFMPPHDSMAVARLAEAGAILTGKTNMVEFAFGTVEHNDAFGSPHNPWKLDATPGGSSSGSGVAVAAGEIPLALGTDTAGSIRIPCAFCGLSGLKPTYGTISRYGVTPLSWSLDHVGPMARTIEDVAIAMNILAGHDSRDPFSVRYGPEDYTRGLNDGIQGLRVAIPKDYVREFIDAEVEATFHLAVDKLQDLGCSIDEVSIPELGWSWMVGQAITMAEAASYHVDHINGRGTEMQPLIRKRIEAGYFISAKDYLQAQRVRSLLGKKLEEVFERYSLLILPTVPVTPPALGQMTITLGDTTLPVGESTIRLTRPFNLNGLPAASIPCGRSSEGTPSGLQLVGRPFNDALVLGAAHAYQVSTNWHLQFPALL